MKVLMIDLFKKWGSFIKYYFIVEIGNFITYKRLRMSQHSKEIWSYLEFLVSEKKFEIIN
jgi:hypothetical protein